MKKVILSLLIVISVLFMFTACTKNCYTCTNVYGSSTPMKFCKEDFASADDYKQAIKLVEDAGANCK